MKKTIGKLILLLAFVQVFMGVNTVFAASGQPTAFDGGGNGIPGEGVIGFEAYKCTSYVEAEGDVEDGLFACQQAYVEGTAAIRALQIPAGGSIDKEDYLMIIYTFESDVDSRFRFLNTSVSYNDSALDPITIYGDAVYLEDSDYPTKKQGKNWVSRFSLDSSFAEEDGRGIVTWSVGTTDSDQDLGLNQTQNIGYSFFQVKSDASGSLPFSYYDVGASPSGASGAGQTIYINQQPLTINVSGGASSDDNTLDSITISNTGKTFTSDSSAPFTPGSKTNTTYLYYVGDLASTIDIKLVANHSGALVTSATLTDLNATDLDSSDRVLEVENVPISFGMNTFYVTVQAQNQVLENYIINVYRLSNDASVTNITADGIELTRTGDVFAGLTSFSDFDTTIYATPSHQNATVTSGAGSWVFQYSGPTINTRNVVVSAENCADEYRSVERRNCVTKTYRIDITRSNASNDATLSDLAYGFNNASVQTVSGFSSSIETYNLGDVPYSTDEISIDATLNDSNAQILSGEGTFNIAVGNNEFKVVVLAQDGTTQKTYKLNVHRKSDDRTLYSLTATSNPASSLSPAFGNSYTGTYTYGYDPTVEEVTISATVNDTGKAKVAIVDSTSGQPATYTSSLNSATLKVNTPATTSVSVIVTSEDGGVRIYPISLVRQQSNDNYLAGLVVQYEKGGTQTATLVPGFGAATRKYDVTIPADIDTVTVIPTKASTYATIRRIGDTTGSDLSSATITGLAFGKNEKQIVVYSESGNDNPYTLNINRSKYNISTLDALSLGTGTFTTAFASGTTSYTYSSNIPYSQNTISINGTKTNSYASVQVSVTDEKSNVISQTITEGANNTFSGTLNLPTGTSTVGVLVTAHDGTTKTYTVSITREKNNDSTVSSLIVDGQVETPTYEDSTHTYKVTVPFNTVAITPAQVAVTPTDPIANVSKGLSVSGFSTTAYTDFTFRVTAENGSYTDYTVKIIKKKNDAALLTRETVKVGTNSYYCEVNQSTKTCTISVPVSTEGFTLHSTISENALVSPIDGTEVSMPSTESEKTIPIIVTSEDGNNSNTYNIKVERSKSSDNSLSDLQVDGTTVSDFTATGNVFTDIEGGSTSQVLIKAKVSDVGKASVSKATVNGSEVTVNGNISNGEFTFDAPLNYGANTVVITVIAENNQPQNFTLTITRQQNVTATIDRLDFGAGSDTPTKVLDWNKDGSTYTFETVDYNTTSITLVAYPGDATYGTAMVTKVVDEKNNTTQTNMPNETTDAGLYKVTIPLTTGTNTITLVGYAHNITITKPYTITIVRTKNSDNSISDVKVKNTPCTAGENNTFTVTLPNSVSSITASDITYTLPAGATASVSPASMNLSTQTLNTATITVTSEGGVAQIYNVNITRTKSNNADLNRVSLKIVSTDSTYNGKDYYCNFDTTTAVACTIDVPASTTGYTITSTLADSTASVVPTNGTADTMSSSESTKIINLEVTAEDESKKDYTVTVRRTKSSNTNLASLTIDGTPVVGFTPGGTLYYADVDGDTEEVLIAATVEDVGRATITNASVLANPRPVGFGANRLDINVKAEDGTEKTIYIQVTRLFRTDATLKSITVNGNDLNSYVINPATFSSNVYDYEITVPFDYSVTSLTVGATVNDPDLNAKISSGVGTTSLQTGSTTITLHVIAHDTRYTQDYTIKVTRNKNNDTSISAISLAGNTATYNENDGIWEVEVPNSVSNADTTNLIVTPSPGATTNDKLATVAFTPTALDTQAPTDIPITVTAEDGTIDNSHVLRVTRLKSNVATLHELTVTNGSFNPSFKPDDETSTVYTVTVPESISSIDISAVTTDPNARIVTGTGNFALTASNQSFQIQVESEDKSNNVYYQLNVTRTKSSDNTLKLVTVTNGTTSYDIYNYDSNALVAADGFGSVSHYKVTVPGDITEVVIGAVQNDSRATVDSTNLGTKQISVGEKSYTIKVTSESGATNTYTLTIIREKKSNNYLSSLKVNNQLIDGFDPEITEYDLGEVDNSVATVIINAEPDDSDATIKSGIGTQDLNTGLNQLKVVVKAQNETERTYTIKITRAQSTDNRLSLLSVNGYSISPTYSYVAPPAEETHEYNVNLRYNKGTFGGSDITAIAHNSTASVAFDDDITIDTGETKSFNIYVTSESGATNIYTLRVTRAKSDNAYLTGVTITVGDGTKNATISPVFNKTVTNYTVSIPYGETTFTISGTPEVSSTVVTGNNATYNVGDQETVTLTTYAETYRVDGEEAERNATMTYTFTIDQSQSNNAYLSDLYVNGYGFKNPHPAYSQAYTNYDIGDIESDITGLIINATPENANATISYRVNSGSESTNNVVTLPGGTGAGTITITVTAPDGLTSIPYTISYNKVYGTNAYLLSLESDVGTMNPQFIKSTRDYIISVDNEVNEVNLTMYTEKRSSNVQINGGLAVSATDIRPYTYTVSDLIVGDTPVTIVAEAEDGQTSLTYNVIIRKAQPSSSSDATLSRLSVDGYPFISEGAYTATSFAKATTDYSIGLLPYKLDKVKVDYAATQGESSTSILVNGRSIARDSDGYISLPIEDNNNGLITVVVVAPNGTSSKTYNIHYRKKASSDATLASMVVSEGTLSPTFASSTLGYEVELPDGVNNETITVTLNDPGATLTVGGQEKNSPYVHAITGLGSGTHRASFVVTAENGTELTYYIDIKVNSGDEKITSVVYGHTIDATMIKTVKVNTTGLDLKNQLDNDNAKLQIWKADDSAQISDSDKVATGMIVKLIIDGTEKDRKLVVVKGDVNGDSNINLADAVKVLNHYLEKSFVTGVYYEAGDTNNDGNVNLADAVKILNHYLEKSYIS